MNHLERLREDKNFKWLLFEEKRLSEIIINYHVEIHNCSDEKRKEDIKRIIGENSNKLNIVIQYKNEVSRILANSDSKTHTLH